MYLLQIEYFYKVAQMQHMTNAAKALHISQPALSKTIRLLEEEIGVPLFDRVGKSVQLNEAGHIFMTYAETLLSVLSAAKTKMADYADNNEVTVFVSLRIAPTGFPNIVAEFRKLHPNVKFDVEQHQYLANNFGKGKSDLIVYSSIDERNAPNDKTIMKERILLMVPRTHPLAEYDSIDLAQVANEELLGSTPQDNVMDTCINTFCKMAGFEPKIATACDDFITIMNFVRAGIGLGFMPESTLESVKHLYPDLKFLNIQSPECCRYVNVRWDPQRYVSNAAIQFREFLINYYDKIGMYLRENPLEKQSVSDKSE